MEKILSSSLNDPVSDFKSLTDIENKDIRLQIMEFRLSQLGIGIQTSEKFLVNKESRSLVASCIIRDLREYHALHILIKALQEEIENDVVKKLHSKEIQGEKE